MNKIIPICLVILCLSACKKDELKNSYAPFVGEWEWIRTKHGGTRDKYGNVTGEQTSNPGTEGYNYRLKIRENGSFKKFKNNFLVGYGRIQIIGVIETDSMIDLSIQINEGILQLRRSGSFTYNKINNELSVGSMPMNGANYYRRK